MPWLAVPEVAELLGLSAGQVRKLIEDKALLASRAQGALRIPGEFLVEGEPLAALRGTAYLLNDAGFDSEESVQWLLSDNELLGTSPVLALRAGRKTEVRRIAQAMA